MITIGITAFKEEKTIGKCLNSILSQELPKEYEILVACPDKPTKDIVKEYVKENKKIKLIRRKPNTSKSEALNLIFKHAKGKFIVCTCGDSIWGKNCLRLLLRHFQDPEVGAVGARPVLVKQDSFLDDWYEMSKNARHIRRMYEKNNGNVMYITGNLFAIRQDVIRKISEIPKDTCLDDGTISLEVRLQGFKLEYEPKARVYIKCPATLKDFIKQASRNNIGQYQMKIRYGKKIQLQKKIRSFYTFNFGPKKFFVFFILWLVYLLSYVYGFWLIKTGAGISKIWTHIETTKR